MNTNLRWAHLLGQCCHESTGFIRVRESLSYTTPERLMKVWPSRFPTVESARPYLRSTVKLADKVYGGRKDLGNTEPGDGARFLGRGYIQITGRDNYTRYGKMIGVDLVKDPAVASNPDIAWQIAVAYFLNHRVRGRTPAEWADLNHPRNVTKLINGGDHGLKERIEATGEALKVLEA